MKLGLENLPVNKVEDDEPIIVDVAEQLIEAEQASFDFENVMLELDIINNIDNLILDISENGITEAIVAEHKDELATVGILLAMDSNVEDIVLQLSNIAEISITEEGLLLSQVEPSTEAVNKADIAKKASDAAAAVGTAAAAAGTKVKTAATAAASAAKTKGIGLLAKFKGLKNTKIIQIILNSFRSAGGVLSKAFLVAKNGILVLNPMTWGIVAVSVIGTTLISIISFKVYLSKLRKLLKANIASIPDEEFDKLSGNTIVALPAKNWDKAMGASFKAMNMIGSISSTKVPSESEVSSVIADMSAEAQKNSVSSLGWDAASIKGASKKLSGFYESVDKFQNTFERKIDELKNMKDESTEVKISSKTIKSIKQLGTTAIKTQKACVEQYINIIKKSKAVRNLE